MNRTLASRSIAPSEEIERNKWRQKAGDWLVENCLSTMKKAAITVAVPVLIAVGSSGCGARTGLWNEDNAPDPVVDAGVDSDVSDSDVEADAEHDSDVSDGDVNDGDIESDGDLDVEVDGDVDDEPDATPYDPVISPLIGDYLNRSLSDREDNIPGDSDSEYPLGGSHTSENANPFTNGMGGDLGVTESFMHRIDWMDSDLLVEWTTLDNDVGNIYLEQQSLWVSGDTHYDETEGEVVGDIGFIAYTLEFSHASSPENGIPVCTDAEGTDFSACILEGGDMDVATATHRLQVRFLGSEWIVLGMEPPSSEHAPLSDENGLVNGGMIILGKESAGGIMNQDEPFAHTFPSGETIYINLDDVEAHGGIDSAIISFIAEDGTILERDRLSPGQTKEFVINGEELMLHVFKNAPGYTMGAKWTDFSVLSRRVEFEDGHELNMDEDDNPAWEVALGWSNRGASTEDLQADDLVMVSVYSYDIEDISSSASNELLTGDHIPIVTEPEEWQFIYGGLDITSDERHPLEIEIAELPIGIVEGSGPVDDTGEQVACLIYAPYITIQVGDSETFVVHGTTSGTATSNLVMIASSGGECEGTIGDLNEGDLLMHVSPSSTDNALARYRSGTVIEFATIGEGASWETGGIIQVSRFEDTVFSEQGPFASETPDFFIGIVEDAGPESSDFVSSTHIGAWLSTSSPTFNRELVSSGGDAIFTDDGFVVQMAGPVDTGRLVVDEGYITERGSVLGAVTDTTVTMSVAERVVHTSFFLVPYMD